MKIVHRISENVTAADRQILARLGIMTGEGINGLVTFEVDEDHEHWSAIAAWVNQRGSFDLVNTVFTKKEINQADWLVLMPSWHHGYPQPDEDNNGYLQTTYDRGNYCEMCGMGLKQKASFQMKGEPKWGRMGILQMNWVYDQYFVRPEVWETVFKPFGISCRPVINRKGAELKTVLQLDVSEEVDMKTEGLRGEACKLCGRIKCQSIVRGQYPPLIGSPKAAMVRSRDYFGSEGSASQVVMISKDLARVFSEAKVQGVSLKPVQQSQYALQN